MKHSPLHRIRPNRGFASLPYGLPLDEQKLYRVERRQRAEQVEIAEASDLMDNLPTSLGNDLIVP